MAYQRGWRHASVAASFFGVGGSTEMGASSVWLFFSTLTLKARFASAGHKTNVAGLMLKAAARDRKRFASPKLR